MLLLTLIVLIYVLVRYGETLVPENAKLFAFIGLVLTILAAAGVLSYPLVRK